MNIEVSGYHNNRPMLFTYCIDIQEPFAEAIADVQTSWFNISARLNKDSEYVLIDEYDKFCGFIMSLGDLLKAVLISTGYTSDWTQGRRFRVYEAKKISEKLNY
jgi:hypothetical protein